MQPTNIVLNQANVDSVVFKFKVYFHDEEINYQHFDSIEVACRRPDGGMIIDTAVITPEGAFYRLSNNLFRTVGTVDGYLKLHQVDRVSATLHFNFRIISELVNAERICGDYIFRLEDVIREAKELLAGLQSGAWVTAEWVNARKLPIVNPLPEFTSIPTRMAAWDRISGEEIGTWIPTLYGSEVFGNNIYYRRFGTYRRVGRAVSVTAEAALTVRDPAMAGELRMNLPIPPTNIPGMPRYTLAFAWTHFWHNPDDMTVLQGMIRAETNFIQFTFSNGQNQANAMPYATSGCGVLFNATYIAVP